MFDVEEIEGLRAELRLLRLEAATEVQIARLMGAFEITEGQSRLLLALLQAGERWSNKRTLDALIPGLPARRIDPEFRSCYCIAAQISYSRKKLPAGTIESRRGGATGGGYRLSESGRNLLNLIIS